MRPPVETSYKLSPGTIRRIDWRQIRDAIGVALDQLGGDRSAKAEAKEQLSADVPERAMVEAAFRKAEAEFKRALEPLRLQMRFVSAFVLISFAVGVCGGVLTMFNRPGGGVLSVAGISAMFMLLVRAQQLSRDQAMLELIPARFELALQLSSTAAQFRQVLNRFLEETSSLHSGKRSTAAKQ